MGKSSAVHLAASCSLIARPFGALTYAVALCVSPQAWADH